MRHGARHTIHRRRHGIAAATSLAVLNLLVISPLHAQTDGSDLEPAAIDFVENDVADDSANLSVDVDRWVLHDILMEGFAATGETGDANDDDDATVTGEEEDLPLTRRLAQLQLMARLRGEPQAHHTVDIKQLALDIPIVDHPLVDVYIEYFTGRGRGMFATWLQRAMRYAPIMQPILAAKGVPTDLLYLAMIESGLSAKAYSTAAASGYWQFINSTGKLFGLVHTDWVDERRDFVRATEAAATYLAQLYQTTGNWHLAWASYNAGEGRVRRAMERYAVRDFWQLISYKSSLAKETMHYVPKIIAAAIVAKDPERYGFTNLQPLPPLVFDEVQVHEATSLQAVANLAHIPLSTLQELNPALLHDVTPPGRSATLRVPQGLGARVAGLLDGLPAHKRLAYRFHHVRPGDTLSAIAQRYHASIEAIRQFNRLASTRLRPGQNLIVPSLPSGTPRKGPTRTGKAERGHPRARHVVATGETLWSIARQYGVTVDRIKTHNRRHGNQLAVGEVLEIF